MVGTSRRIRIARAALVGVVLMLVLPVGGSTDAAEATLQPSPTGYYTATQDPFKTISAPVGEALCSVPSPDPRTCLNPAQLTGGTPGYPRRDNYGYVATLLGNEDADTVVGVPLFSIPLGATINSLVLDFFVENEPNAGTLNFTPEEPHMQLCLIKEGWAGQDGAAIEARPDTDCGVNAEPKYVKSEERSEMTEEGVPQDVTLELYTVDLMPMANAWANGQENNGVMIRPTADAPTVFEAAIRTPGIAPDGMTIKVSYDAPAPTPLAPAAPTENAPTFGDNDAPAAEEPEPSFEVPEASPPAEDEVVAAPVNTKVTTPWWTFLALPFGLAMLAALGRGTAAEASGATESRAGPVSKLMNRGGHRP